MTQVISLGAILLNPVKELYNPEHFLCSYPTLFPFGFGGIMDARQRIKLSYRYQVNCLLRLNCERFRAHQSFTFVVFNIIQKAEARQNINMLIKQRDFLEFANEIKALKMVELEQAAEKIVHNIPLDPSDLVYKLLNKAQTSTGRVQGAKAAQTFRRNEIRALIVYYGLPHFFITIMYTIH